MLKFDFLVIGSGIAGLSYALKVAKKGTVAIVTKKRSTDSNTNYAQGGIAAVIAPTDSFEAHLADTIAAGCGLSRPDVVEAIVKAGPRCIQELIDIGVNFSLEDSTPAEAHLHLSREGGHSARRVVHAADATGREIEKALLHAVHENPNISVFENHIAVDLIMSGNGEEKCCLGVICLDSQESRAKYFYSGSVLLATGGAGVVYKHTSNPTIATGDGVAMAYRAGASVANMEFIQFHPTTLYNPGGESFLISEAVRGEGGLLFTQAGVRFMDKYHPSGELAARDVVARAIDSELKASGDPCVYLDVTHLGRDLILKRFPNIFERCLKSGIDISLARIPVVPAAHYICGGVCTDLQCRTDIKNLYACGEVGMTGLHGANRLASNSLLEAVATAQFAADIAKVVEIPNGAIEAPLQEPKNGITDKPSRRERVLLKHDRSELLNLMWDYVGVVRSDYRLHRARERVNILVKDIEDYFQTRNWSYDAIELRNLATCAKLIIDFAIERKESRGLHYNIDHPDTDDINWRRDLIRKEEKWL
ncbi:MAG: L-aspartate oxidase [bacterium]|nr:L-aspartate oxidase [bacterium]